MNAPALLEEFKGKYQDVMTEIAARGTYLDREDISNFFSLSLPGLDEVMAILAIADLVRQCRYDLVILDTAPTGHTLRLLAMPEEMLTWVHVLDLMQAKHRYLVKRFTRRYKPDGADAFIKRLVADMKGVRALLKSKTTEFVPVVVPEPMVMRETERLLAALKRFDLCVKTMVVNRVEDSRNHCEFCSARRKAQEAPLAQLQERFAAYKLVKVPAFPQEVRGTEALRQFGRLLFEGSGAFERCSHPRAVRASPPSSKATLADLLKTARRCLFFAGKGGVGKTTLAAATALRLVGNHPSKNVLIYSIDPAHSLSDSFDCSIGQKLTAIPGVRNLYAFEIDPRATFRAYRQTYRAGVERAFEQMLGQGTEIAFDREVMRAMFDLSPPGLDEIMALETLAEFVEQGSFDIYVLDTAPTGHLIRFLELPGTMKGWLDTLLRILLKYKTLFSLKGMSSLIERLLASAKKARTIRELLLDPAQTEFVAVTIPEGLGVLEVKRLFSTLRTLRIPCQHLVVNKVIPATACSFCARKRAEEQRYLQELRALKPHFASLPLLAHEISGLHSLTLFSRIIFDGAGN